MNVTTTIELAAALRANKAVGRRLANAIHTLGLVTRPGGWSRDVWIGHSWSAAHVAPLVTVDMAALRLMCLTGDIRRVRNLGVHSQHLLYRLLGPLGPTPSDCCPHCGRRFLKHLRPPVSP